MRGLVLLLIVASTFIVTAAYSQESTQLNKSDGIGYEEQSQSIGPIKPTDTLWRIAVKVRPDNSVTIYQVMQALYNKNPNSFLEQNLNHIKSGAYLKVPTLAQIKRIDNQLARQRAEQDDNLWAAKKNGVVNQVATNAVQTQIIQASTDDISTQAGNELTAIALAKNNKLFDLQQQFKQSVSNLEEILVENDNLKQQLTNVSNELSKVRQQLGQDSEIQQQLKALIVKQNEIIAQQKFKQAEQEARFDFVSLLSNPPVFILLMAIPALLIIFAVMMLLRKRANNSAPIKPDDYFIAPVSNCADALVDERAQHKADVFFTPPDMEKASTVHGNEHIDFALPAPQNNDDILNADDKDRYFAEPAETLAKKPIDNNIDANDSIDFHDEMAILNEALADDSLNVASKRSDSTAGDLHDNNNLRDNAQNEVNDAVCNDYQASIDVTLANSIEELTEAQVELKHEDVEAIAAAFNHQLESEHQHDINNAFSDTSESLLDSEDSVEEYNDDTLKSVDELLNELQQTSADDASGDSFDEVNEHAEVKLTTDSPLSFERELVDSELAASSEHLDKAPTRHHDEEHKIGPHEQQSITPELPANSSVSMGEDEQVNTLENELNDQAIDDFLIELDDIQDKQLNQDLSDGQTNVEHEAAITQTPPLQRNDNAAVDEVVTSRADADAIALLNKSDVELNITDSSEFGVDFDSLANENVATGEVTLNDPTENSSVTIEPISAANFVDIDSLLTQTDTTELEYEPYNDVNIDVGLSEFDAFLAGDNRTDVDTESGGYAAKLDLARAYIEIDDADAALKMINEIINKGPEEVQAEALSLKAKLK